MNAKNEAMEWLDSGNDNIYDAEEIIENLLKALEAADKFIMQFDGYQSIPCASDPDSPPCFIVDADIVREALKEYKANQMDKEVYGKDIFERAKNMPQA